MEQDQNTSLFGLGIDNISKSHLSEAAKWARFLAICGFVFLGLMVVYGIFMSFVFANMMGTMSKYDSTYSTNSLKNIMGAGMIIFYIVCAVIAFGTTNKTMPAKSLFLTKRFIVNCCVS